MSRSAYMIISLTMLIFSCKQPVHVNSRPVLNNAVKNSAQTDKPADAILTKEHVLDSMAAVMRQPVADDTDTASINNERVFVACLTNVLQDDRTFTYSFPALHKHDITILTSDDHRLRIFSWQSSYSGSMWQIQNILQFKDVAGKVSVQNFNALYQQKDEGAPTPAFEAAYHLNAATGSDYLLLGHGQMSGTEPYAVAHLLSINSYKFDINKKRFIINGKPDNEIYVGVTIKPDDDFDKVKNSLTIRYNPAHQTIIYPEVKETANGTTLTGKYKQLSYQNRIFKQ